MQISYAFLFQIGFPFNKNKMKNIVNIHNSEEDKLSLPKLNTIQKTFLWESGNGQEGREIKGRKGQ